MTGSGPEPDLRVRFGPAPWRFAEYRLPGGDFTPAFGAPPAPAGIDAAGADHLLAALRAGTTLPLPDGGRLCFVPEPGALPAALPPARALAAIQTNQSFVAGPILLKFLRRARPGIHPAAEMVRFLGAHGFRACPSLVGEILRIGPDGTPATIAIAERLIENSGDGWHFVLARLEAGDRDAILGFAARLAQTLAAMHACLAAAPAPAAFAAIAADQRLRAGWGRDTAALLTAIAPHLPDRTILPRLLARIGHLSDAAGDAIACRIHGDFHLGQILLDAAGQPVIVDFEGEPDRPLAQRRARHSPLRDVAGMLRSFAYAGATAGTASANALCAEAGAVFRATYLDAMHAWPRPAAHGPAIDALLGLFWIDKAAYEVGYEAAHRPHLLPIPLAALAAAASP